MSNNNKKKRQQQQHARNNHRNANATNNNGGGSTASAATRSTSSVDPPASSEAEAANTEAEPSSSPIASVNNNNHTFNANNRPDPPPSSSSAVAFSQREQHGQLQQDRQQLLQVRRAQQLKDARTHKEEGNAALLQGRADLAVDAYSEGLECLAGPLQLQEQAAAATTLGGDDDDADADELVEEAAATLYSNRAQAYLKLGRYVDAQHDCTFVLERLSGGGPGGGPGEEGRQRRQQQHRPKVWYRRALAREEQAKAILLLQGRSSSARLRVDATAGDDDDYNDSKRAIALLHLAKRDLQASLAAMAAGEEGGENNHSSNSNSNNSPTKLTQQQGMKAAVAKCASRLQGLLGQCEQPRPERERLDRLTSGSSGSTRGSASAARNAAVVTPPKKGANGSRTTATAVQDPAQQQKDAVLQLLAARHRGLVKYQQQQQHQQSLSSYSSSGATVLPGEAFYLIDWDWWYHWCSYVGMVELAGATPTTNNGSSSSPAVSKKNEVLLKLLPVGATLPEEPRSERRKDGKEGGGDDDSTSSSSSGSSNDSTANGLSFSGPPGPIDNTALFLMPPDGVSSTENGRTKKKAPPSTTLQLFRQQWYGDNDATPSSSVDDKDDASSLRLQPQLVRGYHYEALPREVYSALRSWYGEVTPSVCRRVTATAFGDQKSGLILYPYHWKQQHPADQAQLTLTRCSACQAPHAQNRCTRCFRVRYCDRKCQESHWPFHRSLCTPAAVSTPSNDEENDGDPVAASDGAPTSSPTASPTQRRRSLVVVEEDEPAQLYDGRVGLNQLGNTCFMNSAVQSLSHVTPLTRYFLSNRYHEDLNQNNALGTGGKLANAYNDVLKDLWMKFRNDEAGGGGHRRHHSTSPTTLKRAIALFAPRFAGCLQHDAQEFLAYMLDGLHEDCNRIRTAPYVTMPDVNHGQNMAVAGARAWDAHRRRNDSLVLDSFYGQFKSTCVCPRCHRVSVSFDAFNHLSLELPDPHADANTTVTLFVRFFFAAGVDSPARKPLRCGIEVLRSSFVADIKHELSNIVGVQTDRMVLCEVFGNNISGLLGDEKPVAQIRPDDFLVVYEVEPTTSPCFHAVCNHAYFPPEYQQREPQRGSEAFGRPFMTSFPAELTCRQAWDHVWSNVAYMVDAEDKDILQLRVLNERGMPMAVFPSARTINEGDTDEPVDDEEEDGISPVDVRKSSLIPRELDEPLTSFLGEDAVNEYLLVRLEWNDPAHYEMVDAATEQEPEQQQHDDTTAKGVGKAGRPRIDEDRFNAHDTHTSFVEAVQKLRAEAATKNGIRGVTVDQCFDHFTKPERLDEQNMWYCSRCREHVRAMKTMQLWRLPNVLIVHLKRFEFRHVLRRDKLDTFVDFPLEGLDMSAHCASTDADPLVDSTVPADYDCFAVINHYGRLGFGHYTAFARRWDETGISPDWTLFDDSSTRDAGDGRGQNASVDGVVSPAAYVLFYRRRIFN